MISLAKFSWVIRYFIYSLIYKNIKMPGYIGRPVHLMNIKLFKFGKNVRIFPNARLEVYRNGVIEIKDNVSIGQNVHITSAGKLVINSGTLITANVCITNIDHVYEDIDKSILSQNMNVNDTIIGENCFIGNGVMIQAGTILGRHNIVGANSVVKGEYPDYCVIVGAPAKIIKTYNQNTKKWELVDSILSANSVK